MSYPVSPGKKVRNAGFFEARENSTLSEDYFRDPSKKMRRESSASHDSAKPRKSMALKLYRKKTTLEKSFNRTKARLVWSAVRMKMFIQKS